ncbi:MAG: hypothetical protein MUP30_09620 [Deltaproteobacteria bacterium]|nr:hypothetical protein [Deltaproteobacteria bacterium]
MNSFKIAFFIVVPFIILSSCGIVTNKNSTKMLIKKQLDKFLEAECEGDIYIRNDSNLIKFSPESEKILKENLEGARIFLEGSSLIIISSYTIESIKLEKHKATAFVAFRQIAETEDYGWEKRKIVPRLIERSIEHYELIYEKGTWLIYEPPLPRICKETMIKYYEHEVTESNKILESGTASKGQKEFFEKEKQTLYEL